MVITCSIAIFGQLGTLLLVSLATERAIAQNTVLLAVVSFSFNTYVIRSVCSYEIVLLCNKCIVLLAFDAGKFEKSEMRFKP